MSTATTLRRWVPIAAVTLVALGFGWALLDCAGVVPDGHTDAVYTPTGVRAIEVCPSLHEYRIVGDIARAADHLSAALCYPPITVQEGACSMRRPGVAQVRLCGDDPHGHGDPLCGTEDDEGRLYVDSVTSDGQHAWVSPLDSRPGTYAHVVDHIRGIGHTTRASSHAHPLPGLSDSGVPSLCP